MFGVAPASCIQPRGDEYSVSQRQHQQSSTRQNQPQVGPHYPEPLSPALSALDFMHLSPKAAEAAQQQQQQQQQSDRGGASVSPSFISNQGEVLFAGTEDNATQGMAFGMHMNEWNTELPGYIDELLSGAYIYN
jgi:hypothetical protein